MEARVEQIGDARRSEDDVLEVVEDEQEALAAQVVDDRLEQRAVDRFVDAEGVGDGGEEQVGVGEAGERDDEGAVGEIVERV